MPNSIARALLASSTVWMHEAAALTCLPLYFTIEWLHFGKKKNSPCNPRLQLGVLHYHLYFSCCAR